MKFSIVGLFGFFLLSLIVHWTVGGGGIKGQKFPEFILILVSSYYVFAFLFGMKMPVLTANLEKGKHDIIRLPLFLVFIALWLSLMGFW